MSDLREPAAPSIAFAGMCRACLARIEAANRAGKDSVWCHTCGASLAKDKGTWVKVKAE